MSNERNDFDGQEESEYHFSDDEVSYEVENEAPKAAPAAEAEGHKESLIARLSQSKRMIISLGVFLVLVFVAYKMVGQSSSVPATDITAAAPGTVAQPNAVPNQVAANPAQAPQAAAVPVTQPAQAAAATPVAPAVTTTTTTTTTPVTTIATQPVAPTAPEQAIQPPVVQQQAVALPVPGQQNAPVVATLPTVIPVQSSVSNAASPTTQAPSVLSTMGDYIDAKTAALNANSQQAMDQLQGQYTQQMNNFNAQNKALQEQVQTLNSRVAVMESQLNQLVNVLTRHNQAASSGGSSMATPPPMPPQIAQSDVKIAYNVQAIIPGRAWLKSDNGETLTVAEGDMVKDVGRVSKIDPYDGVVEINTGNKVVALSYGNGG